MLTSYFSPLFSFFVQVRLRARGKNQTQAIGFGMSFLMLAFLKILTSSLSLSQVRTVDFQTFSLFWLSLVLVM